MFLAFLDQSTVFEYNLELRFEWGKIFRPLYFKLEKELFNCISRYVVEVTIAKNKPKNVVTLSLKKNLNFLYLFSQLCTVLLKVNDF